MSKFYSPRGERIAMLPRSRREALEELYYFHLECGPESEFLRIQRQIKALDIDIDPRYKKKRQ